MESSVSKQNVEHANDNHTRQDIGPDYEFTDRTFHIQIDRFSLPASNYGDECFSFVRHIEEVQFIHLHDPALENCRDGTETHAALISRLMSQVPSLWEVPRRPNSDNDRIDLGLQALLTPDDHDGLGFISSAGAVAHKGAISLEIHTGQETSSAMAHFANTPETVYIALYANLHRMKWLHQNLLSRPKAKLQISFNFKAYKHISIPEPDDHEASYIRSNSRNPIRNVSFEVCGGER